MNYDLLILNVSIVVALNICGHCCTVLGGGAVDRRGVEMFVCVCVYASLDGWGVGLAWAKRHNVGSEGIPRVSDI